MAVILIPHPPLPRRPTSLLSIDSGPRIDRPRSCGSPLTSAIFCAPSRRSTDNWNSSNADELEWEWKPDQVLTHLVTPFNGPSPNLTFWTPSSSTLRTSEPTTRPTTPGSSYHSAHNIPVPLRLHLNTTSLHLAQLNDDHPTTTADGDKKKRKEIDNDTGISNRRWPSSTRDGHPQHVLNRPRYRYLQQAVAILNLFVNGTGISISDDHPQLVLNRQRHRYLEQAMAILNSFANNIFDPRLYCAAGCVLQGAHSTTLRHLSHLYLASNDAKTSSAIRHTSTSRLTTLILPRPPSTPLPRVQRRQDILRHPPHFYFASNDADPSSTAFYTSTSRLTTPRHPPPSATPLPRVQRRRSVLCRLPHLLITAGLLDATISRPQPNSILISQLVLLCILSLTRALAITGMDAKTSCPIPCVPPTNATPRYTPRWTPSSSLYIHVSKSAPAKLSEGAKAAKKTSKPVVADGDKKKCKKVRKETYSSYIYMGPSFSAPISRNKAMAILNSFVNDIFERIATEASMNSPSMLSLRGIPKFSSAGAK
ncbi:hypothetical protein D9611_014475 [Ephemerocybe angulata]|uniref:Uncharacterized protein n=1 Tax=Ephemerocybe angulata TaxID=980116 RepID=A0A8H5C3N8_9AGAR|nr:hypothetical protein D9611_014475 [Tulosesus angulatus]